MATTIGDITNQMFGAGGTQEFLSNLVSVIAYGGFYVILTVTVGGLVYLWAKSGQYKYSIEIVKLLGGNQKEILNDTARLTVDKQGNDVLELKKLKHGNVKVHIPVPQAQYSYKQEKKGLFSNKSTTHYKFQIDDNFMYHPVKIDMKQQIKKIWNKEAREEIQEQQEKADNVSRFKYTPLEYQKPQDHMLYMEAVPTTRRSWLRLEGERQQAKVDQKNQLTWLMQNVFPWVGFAVLLLLIYFLIQELGPIAEQLGRIASTLDKIR